MAGPEPERYDTMEAADREQNGHAVTATADNESAFHAFEHAGWQRAAEHYADAFGGLTIATAGPLLGAVSVRSGVRLLDVACGPGFIANAAASRGADVVGLDFSSAMVANAARRYPSLVFREGDAEELPYDEGTSMRS